MNIPVLLAGLPCKWLGIFMTRVHQICILTWIVTWSSSISLNLFLIGLGEIANQILCHMLHRWLRKMADELPDDFDVIVLGTGMPCVYKCSNVIKFDVTNLQAFVVDNYNYAANEATVSSRIIAQWFKLNVSRFSHSSDSLWYFDPLIRTLISLKKYIVCT